MSVVLPVRRRRPRCTVIHSDQGCQHDSDDWMRFCRTNRLEPSMSRRGACWDNAVAESFFVSLKKERIKKRIYKNRDLAIADVSDYIDSFYNRIRRHRHVVSQRCAKPQRSAHSGVSSETWELHDSAGPCLTSTQLILRGVVRREERAALRSMDAFRRFR
jgi:hypothetical protein